MDAQLKRDTVTPFGEIGYITFKRTYARRLKEDDPNSKTEEFYQVIERELVACEKQLKINFTDEEKEFYYNSRLKLKWSVAGRFMWQLGTKTVDKLGLPSLQNCAFVVVDSPIRPFTWTFEMLMLGSGVGYNIQREFVYQLPKLKKKVKIERVDNESADFIVPDTREGWVKLLGKVLKSHFYSGEGFTYSTQLIRSKGATIKGFGGTASGPEDLCWGIGEINRILNEHSLHKLRPIDCLDIMNIIGRVVVAGNVRRSAQLAIGDYDDIEFLRAKRWDIGQVPNWRSMSNNSIACNDINQLSEDFWSTYKQGEPYGLINLELARSVGRTGETQYPDAEVQGFNPCVTGETEILTKEGYKRIDSLVGQETEIWNGFEWSLVTPKVTGNNQHTIKVTLRNGVSLICTDYHKWILSKYLFEDDKRVETKDLKIDDEVEFWDKDWGLIPTFISKIEDAGVADTIYCFNEPKRHFGVFNGILTGQCAEQSLHNYETCCLSEVYLPNITSWDEFKKVLETTYKVNKHSLALHCSLKETEDVVHKNMRMGIGITGVLQSNKEQKSWLHPGYKFLREYDKYYSKEHGFPESIKLSTIKPSGTLSLLPGVVPGCHPSPAGPHYIRRVRISSNSNLLEVCRTHGYHIEPQINFDGTNDNSTMVVSFPCKVADGTPVAESYGWMEQIELVKWLQANWSDNAVSCTIYYKKEDLEDIKQYLLENYKENFKTLSFLLYSGHGFIQAPYETITKEKYEELIQNTRPITSVEVDESDFDLQDCSSGACPIK